MKNELTKTAINTNYNKTSLAKAGQFSLSSTRLQSNLLQEVGNDEEFLPLTNVTTAFMDHQGNIVNLPKKKQQRNTQNGRKVSRSVSTLPHAQFQIDYQYAKMTVNMKDIPNGPYESMVKRRKKQKEFLMKNQHELAQIQHIIGQIQQAVNANLTVPLKMETRVVNHSQKRNWQTKGINRFGKNDGISKLEEMLLNYNISDEKLVNKMELGQLLQNAPTKNRERIDRSRKYREISQYFSQKPAEKETKMKPIEAAVAKSKAENQESDPHYIQIVQFEWNKLPIIPSPLHIGNYDLFLKMREFPQNQRFVQAITQVFSGQKHYNTYSIFNSDYIAGIKDENLLSEQEYRQQWSSEWQLEVEEQETKDLLCQFDFQWYRALVQISYSHSLEQLLVKKIDYDVEVYKKNVKGVNGILNDKTVNKTEHQDIELRILYNRLKYVEIVLNSFYQQLIKDQRLKSVVVGVIPTLGEEFGEEETSFVKEKLQEMFLGQLYPLNNTLLMGVVVPVNTTNKMKVEKVSSGLIKLGKVSLLINDDEKAQKAPKVVLRREKWKNSILKMEIFRESQQAMDLQVKKELHYGRCYEIEIK